MASSAPLKTSSGSDEKWRKGNTLKSFKHATSEFTVRYQHDNIMKENTQTPESRLGNGTTDIFKKMKLTNKHIISF